MSTSIRTSAPELAVSEWFNTPEPLTLATLRGRPVFLHSFQLLCPGCVSHALPQLRRIEKTFEDTDLQIVGLHTVFEHHEAMTSVTLRAFIREYRLTSPIGVDLHENGYDAPLTMRRFGFRGTPSSVLIGRDGTILHQSFGVEEDMVVGARIMSALASASPRNTARQSGEAAPAGCSDEACEMPDASATS